MTVVTRFPPSPSGHLHLGGARTALFNWLYARHCGGELVLRIEDTDRARSTQESVDAILDALQWLGLDWQRGPYRQSERFDRYAEIIRRLVDDGHAYHCFCDAARLEALRESQKAAGQNPAYDRHCRDLGRQPSPGEAAVVRFKSPLAGRVAFDDAVRGPVTVDAAQLDDLVIARSDRAPTYNLCVVVDDIDMEVTHIIRGDDHTNNTPRQIPIFHALGAALPVFAHVPMILGADGRRLSKRHADVSVLEYRAQGILPEALLNYLARLGWAHGDREIFSAAEMVELFDLAALNKSAAHFDPAKLLWTNQQHVRAAPRPRLAELLGAHLEQCGLNPAAGPPLADTAAAFAERAQTLQEMADKSAWLYADFDHYDPAAAKKHLRPAAAPALQALRDAFAVVADDDWNAAAINRAIESVLESQKLTLGRIAQPLRVAISGAAATPPIDATVQLTGRARTLSRIERALEWIAAHADDD